MKASMRQSNADIRDKVRGALPSILSYDVVRTHNDKQAFILSSRTCHKYSNNDVRKKKYETTKQIDITNCCKLKI